MIVLCMSFLSTFVAQRVEVHQPTLYQRNIICWVLSNTYLPTRPTHLLHHLISLVGWPWLLFFILFATITVDCYNVCYLHRSLLFASGVGVSYPLFPINLDLAVQMDTLQLIHLITDSPNCLFPQYMNALNMLHKCIRYIRWEYSHCVCPHAPSCKSDRYPSLIVHQLWRPNSTGCIVDDFCVIDEAL